MSIKHALLALLADDPGHGYELKKRYDEAVGLLWPLQQAQVYNNLRLLQQEGLVELDARIAQQSLPDQKRFRLTEAGQRELAAWTGEPVRTNRKLKDDFYLKLTVLAAVMRDPSSAGRSALAPARGQPAVPAGARTRPHRGRGCRGRGSSQLAGRGDPARRG